MYHIVIAMTLYAVQHDIALLPNLTMLRITGIRGTPKKKHSLYKNYYKIKNHVN